MNQLLVSKKVLAKFRADAKLLRQTVGTCKQFNVSVNDLTTDVSARLYTLADATQNAPVTHNTPIQFYTRGSDSETINATITQDIHSGTFGFWYVQA